MSITITQTGRHVTRSRDGVGSTFVGGGGSSGTSSSFSGTSAKYLQDSTTSGLMGITGLSAGSTRIKTVRDTDDTILELAGSYTPTGTWTNMKLGTAILDTNGNELFKFTATGAAVNDITYANAATGVNPRFTASGGDTNIGIDFVPKGTGYMYVYNTSSTLISGGSKYVFRTAISTSQITVDGTYYAIAAFHGITAAYNINIGITDSGYRMALNIAAFTSDATFLGVLDEQIGERIQYGHYTGSGTGTINTAYGLKLEYLSSGSSTITTAYSLHSIGNAVMYHQGHIGVGVSTYLDKFGINLNANVATSTPASSGVNQTGGMFRFGSTPTNGVLDIGNGAASGCWLQVTNKTNLSLTYPLLLNPNGGNVGVHTTTPRTWLDVLGTTTQLRLTYTDNSVYTDFAVSSGGDLTITPTGSDIFIPGGATNVNLKSSNWASRTTGWGIYASASVAGYADFRYISVDELHAKKFIADLEQALAGAQIITKSVAILQFDVVAPAKGSSVDIYVQDLPGTTADVFVSGDAIQLRNFSRSGGGLNIINMYGTVGSMLAHTAASGAEPGYQKYSFTRYADDTGSASGGYHTINKGSIVLDFGVSGDGYVETTTLDSAGSPYQQIVTWATRPWTITPRTRLGNLDGISGIGDEWGLVAGVVANKQYVLLSDQHFELHGVNLSMYDGSTEVFKIDRTAPSLAMGSTLPSGFLVGDGIWMGKDTAYKLRVGTVSGGALVKGFKWDGTDLTIIGGVTATTGAIGGWTISSDRISTSLDSGQTLMALSITELTSTTDYHGRGLSFYRSDALTPTNGVKIVSVGQLRDLNTATTFGATAEYGFEVVAKTGVSTYKHLIRMGGGTNIISGWVIGATSLTDASGTVGMSSAVTAGDDVRFWAGNATPSSAPFRVTEAGVLTSTSGSIGDWTINSTYLAKDTGTDASSSGMAPTDAPFYAGATYANRLSAPFFVSPKGYVIATKFLYGYVLSSSIIVSHDAVAQTTSLTAVKVKTITIGADLQNTKTLRITFDLASIGTSTVNGQVYRNGVAVGTLRSAGVGGSTFSEDISGWSAGDAIQIYAYKSPSSTRAEVSNFRLLGSFSSIANEVTGTTSTP